MRTTGSIPPNKEPGRDEDDEDRNDTIPFWSFKQLAFSRLAVAALWVAAVGLAGTFVGDTVSNDRDHDRQCAQTQELIRGLRSDVDRLHSNIEEFPSPESLTRCGERVSTLEQYTKADDSMVNELRKRVRVNEARMGRILTLFNTITGGKYQQQMLLEMRDVEGD